MVCEYCHMNEARDDCWSVTTGPRCATCRGKVAMSVAGMLAQQGAPHNAVTAPAHYTRGKISAIEVIEDWRLGFALGSVIKYISRYDAKGGLEDLQKAQWYLARAIETYRETQSAAR
jgi:Protein of unknwon function (DUF3310)